MLTDIYLTKKKGIIDFFLNKTSDKRKVASKILKH